SFPPRSGLPLRDLSDPVTPHFRAPRPDGSGVREAKVGRDHFRGAEPTGRGALCGGGRGAAAVARPFDRLSTVPLAPVAPPPDPQPHRPAAHCPTALPPRPGVQGSSPSPKSRPQPDRPAAHCPTALPPRPGVQGVVPLASR